MGTRRWRKFSSDEVLWALQRGGFEICRTDGSHCTLKRKRVDGQHDMTVVVLDQKPVPDGTMKSILALANVEYDEFLVWAKVRVKGRRR